MDCDDICYRISHVCIGGGAVSPFSLLARRRIFRFLSLSIPRVAAKHMPSICCPSRRPPTSRTGTRRFCVVLVRCAPPSRLCVHRGCCEAAESVLACQPLSAYWFPSLVFRVPFLQNPESKVSSVRESLREIYRNRGISGLWHGTSAGVMKTVPKYCVAVTVKVRGRGFTSRGVVFKRR